MAVSQPPVDDRIKALAISLQREKTAMEIAGLQVRHWDAYWKLSEAIWTLEKSAGISAPALRDAEDARVRRQSP